MLIRALEDARFVRDERGKTSGMAARAGDGIAVTLHEVADRARRLVRLEAELARIELRRKVAALGSGIALLAAAAVLGVFAIGFGLATVAAALQTFLPLWLALLIVTVSLVLTALIGALVGRGLLRRATPPLPEQALAEARATGEALRGDHGG